MECNHKAQMLFFLDIEVLLRTLIKIIAMFEFILTIRVQVAGEKQANMQWNGFCRCKTPAWGFHKLLDNLSADEIIKTWIQPRWS